MISFKNKVKLFFNIFFPPLSDTDLVDVQTSDSNIVRTENLYKILEEKIVKVIK